MAFCGQCGTKSSGGAFCTECGAAIGGSSAPARVAAPTSYEDRCAILAELWVNHKNDDEFEDFMTYNDLGLPLAYAVANDIADSNDRIERFVNETFETLLEALSIEDAAYESLSEMLDQEDD